MCREGRRTQRLGQHKYEPIDDDDTVDNDDFDLFNSGYKGSKKTTFTTQPSPSVTLSAAGDAPKTPEQLLAAALKELQGTQEAAEKGTRTEGQTCSPKQQRL